ncbi:DNA primase, partial [candidate division WOR-3 bacterium]|nr:DNA primase [candidate division WOR-3 bacterium]MBD3364631.1 DNA primase [candidate division WOR-3 bacterium]
MIPKEIIERVRTETDIVGLIGEYVKLKRVGRSFVGLCPFHKEKTPSFNVSPDRQAYYCFGCGQGGNAITFIMNYENLSFPEAVKRLAERLGIRISYTAQDDPTKPLVQALEMALKQYQDNLWSEAGIGALQYLTGRGLSKETVKSFGLGLVAGDVSGLLSAARQAKLPTKVLSEAGVLGNRDERLYPFLSGRIVFPIYSASGKLVGFSGRVWGDDDNPAKYINTPESRVFKKRKTLYGLSKARAYLRREGVVVVEGQTDVLKLVQSGFHNVVAPLGTAFTAEQARLLSRYADKVTLVFDGDQAGRKAAQRALGEVLAADLDVGLLLLPEGEDPDSYITAHSPDEFSRLLEQASEPIPFLYKLVNPKGTRERRQTAELMTSVIRKAPDRLRRELYLDEAAELIGVDRSVLAPMARPEERDTGVPGRTSKNCIGIGDLEERLLRMMIQDAEYVRLAKEKLPVDFFPEGPKRELLAMLYDFSAEHEGFNAGQVLDLMGPELRRRVS